MEDLRLLAEQIKDIDFYEALDNDTTTEDIEKMLEDDPITIIKWLVDIIEDYQAPGK